jgi:hypothetical protein
MDYSESDHSFEFILLKLPPAGGLSGPAEDPAAPDAFA